MLARTICKFSLLSAVLVLSACMPSQQQERPIEIRIVDLNGNPSNVKKFVPEGNIQAMASQSANPAMAQSPVIETQAAQPAVQQLPPVAMQPQVNNLANITNSVVGTEAAKEPETTISYDMSNDAQGSKAPAVAAGTSVADSQPVAPTSSGAKKFKFVTAAGAAKQTANAKSAKSSAKVFSGSKAKSASGKFIQIGSFASEEKANEILNDSSKISSGTIEEVKVGGKATYRVLLGPVDGGPAKAQQVLSKVKQSGYKDAFIVK